MTMIGRRLRECYAASRPQQKESQSLESAAVLQATSAVARHPECRVPSHAWSPSYGGDPPQRRRSREEPVRPLAPIPEHRDEQSPPPGWPIPPAEWPILPRGWPARCGDLRGSAALMRKWCSSAVCIASCASRRATSSARAPSSASRVASTVRRSSSSAALMRKWCSSAVCIASCASRRATSSARAPSSASRVVSTLRRRSCSAAPVRR